MTKDEDLSIFMLRSCDSRLVLLEDSRFTLVAEVQIKLYFHHLDPYARISRMKKNRQRKLRASVKPAKGIPKLPAGKWTSTLA